jgi:hypothetical protein
VPGAGSPQEPDQSRAVSAPGRAPGQADRRRWGTIRFFALRMHEAGVIKLSPQKIIADGMDWRFVNELKKEIEG